MSSEIHVMIHNTRYSCDDAVRYHTGQFPPTNLEYSALISPLTETAMMLARFDTMLRGLPNSELLLAPLRARDAVVSSRMEGTISTLEEVLRLEADAENDELSPYARNDAVEVALYARALRQAERQIAEQHPITGSLIRQAHRTLLSFGRGATNRPGQYKEEQNYIGNRRDRRIDFIPISPVDLQPGMDSLFDFVRSGQDNPILKTAIAHAEFEALHPFEDGNGRLGRMMITLLLWHYGILSAPHFFVSDYFERNKSEYIERLRGVSRSGDWTGWCIFFLDALAQQAADNISTVGAIQAHYEDMRETFRDLLRSRWSTDALNYIFANPIFRNNRFTRNAGIPKPTANGFTNRLVDAGMLTILIPPSGRAPGMYAFPSLLEIVQEPS